MRSLTLWPVALAAAGAISAATLLSAQEPVSPQPPSGAPVATAGPVATPGPAAESAPAPRGVEVLTRGPVHEAFATPTSEPQPTTPVAKKPPQPVQEMPPEEKPEGDVNWIGGYWAWDDDRSDYLWVSGIWRSPPPNKRWVGGYWREDGAKWQWVPGFWSEAQKEADKHEVTYLPKPPEPPQTVAPGAAPNADSFYVPGQWAWRGDSYAWRAGYWARVQPDYVWVPAHFRWTPYGYVYIGGYWDLAVAHRGVIYAPVVVDPEVVPVGFVYTPSYVVRDTVVIDAFFVRPCYCHYYFGDYYGPVYRERGFESVVVYSGRHYDSIIVYERWNHRADPRWETVQVNVYFDRCAGRAPCPPRTMALQVRSGREVVVASARVREVNGARMVRLDAAARGRVHEEAHAIHQASVERRVAESRLPVGQPTQPRVASVPIPHGYPATTRPPATTAGAEQHPSPHVTPATSARPGPALTPAPGQPAAQPGQPGRQPPQGTKPPPSKPAPPPPPQHREPPKHPPGDGH